MMADKRGLVLHGNKDYAKSGEQIEAFIQSK